MAFICKQAKKLGVWIMITALLALGTAGSAFAASDITGHWAEPQIKAWLNAGIITGYPDGSFKPNAQVTRAEFMAMVNKAYSFTGTSQKTFKDVSPSAWYANVISVAYGAGYISGYPDGTMHPNGPITRYEAAVVIAKINNLALVSSAASGFSDSSAMPSWAKGSVGAVFQSNIMTGYPNGYFAGGSYITRAESVVSLTKSVATKLEKRVYSKPGIYGTGSVETVKGDVTITASDITLRNMVIEGNLSISKDVGNGDVTLENIIVKGEGIFQGGGPNSITLEDCTIGKITANRESGTMHMIVSGDSKIASIVAKSNLKITETGLTSTGVTDVSIESAIDVSLISTDLENLVMKAVGSTLSMDSRSSIDKVTVSAKDTRVNMASGSTITNFTANAAVKVSGMGTISHAQINATGVTFEAKPEEVIVKSGISAPTYSTPYIESFSPADEATKVALNANIVIKFSETVRTTDGIALTNTNVDELISLNANRASGADVPFDATVAISGGKTIITVNPTEDLLPDEDYYVNVDDLEDVNNNPVTGSTRITFSTLSESVPRIESFNPENGATGVAVDTDIVITFSETVRMINGTALTNTNVDSLIVFKSSGSSGPSVPFDGTVTVVNANTVITVNPTSDLGNSKSYYVAVSGLEDKDNQTVSGTLNATFTTAAPQDPPEIQSFSPLNGATSVSINQNIVITFTEVVRMTSNTALTNSNVDGLVTLKTPNSSGSEVLFDATVATSGGKSVITVNPTASFSGNTTYYVAVSGLEDAYDQALTGTKSASFTTVKLPADDLQGLSVEIGSDGSGGVVTLAPAFDGNVTDYSATVVNGVTAVKVTPDTASGNTAVVSLDSNVMTDGVCDLSVGHNAITITVSKTGRADLVYSIDITREAP